MSLPIPASSRPAATGARGDQFVRHHAGHPGARCGAVAAPRRASGRRGRAHGRPGRLDVETGTKQLRPLFDRALTDGIAAVPEAPEPLRRFFESVEATPDWVDTEALRIGARTLRRGRADGMYIAKDVALLGGYQFSGFNQTLLRTGALERGPTSGSPRPCSGRST